MISEQVLELLLEETKRERFKGKSLTLGKQSSRISAEYLKKRAVTYGVSLASDTDFPPAIATSGGGDDCIDDVSILKALGVSSVTSLDFSDYEGAAGRLYDVFCSVTKTSKSTFDQIPHQRFY